MTEVAIANLPAAGAFLSDIEICRTFGKFASTARLADPSCFYEAECIYCSASTVPCTVTPTTNRGSKFMKSIKLTVVASMSALALAACSGSETSDTTTADTTVVADEGMEPDSMAIDDAAPAAGTQTIVAMAQGNPDVSTLVTAVTAAGLGETLAGAGPFTVFAPTNAAFAKVDKAAIADLMKPENKAKLGEVLKYHVVSGKVTSADLAKMIKDGKGNATVKTLTGTLKASMEGANIVLTDGKGMKSTVTGADMMATNGVVHAVDTVVMK